jgi:hypothetical protein
MGGNPYHLYFQICFYTNFATCGNNNLTTWITSIEIELEKESPTGHWFQQWNGILIALMKHIAPSLLKPKGF